MILWMRHRRLDDQVLGRRQRSGQSPSDLERYVRDSGRVPDQTAIRVCPAASTGVHGRGDDFQRVNEAWAGPGEVG